MSSDNSSEQSQSSSSRSKCNFDKGKKENTEETPFQKSKSHFAPKTSNTILLENTDNNQEKNKDPTRY